MHLIRHSGVSGQVLPFRWLVECGWRCWCSCWGQDSQLHEKQYVAWKWGM